jgi:hypothetical protein
MSGQSHLLTTRRFLPFFGTQFLGAFNDNLYKNALIVLLTFQAASWTTLRGYSSCRSLSSRPRPASLPTNTTKRCWRAG